MVENYSFLYRRITSCVVLPLVIVTSITCCRWYGHTSRHHDELRQALESKGLADNLETLVSRLQKNEDQSKAKRWKSLAASIRHLPGPMQPTLGRVRTVVPPLGQDWEMETPARIFVESHSSILTELCALNNNPAVISLVPDEDFLNKWLDSASDNVLVSAGLDLVGCVALRDNDEAGVLRAIQDLYECRRTLQGVAPAMGAYVRFDFSQRGLFLLKMALERGLFGRESLELLQPMLLEHVEVDSGWLAAIEFELAMHLDIINGRAALKRYPPELSSPIATRVARCIFPPASMIDRMRFLALIQILAEAPTDNLAAFQAAQLQCIFLFAELRRTGTRFDFNATGFANDDNLGGAFIADALRHRLAAAAIAVQLYRIENGSYPNNLQEIALDERLQPLRGRPIGYVKANASSTIWTAHETPWTTPAKPPGDLTVVWTLNTSMP